MKKWMISLAAAVLAVGVVFPAAAQNTGAAGAAQKPAAGAAAKKANRQRGGRMGAALAKLNLTADQKTKIQAIQQDARVEGRKLKQSGVTGEALKAKRREMGKKNIERIMAVLTADQQKALKAEMAKGRGAGKAAGKGKAAKTAKKAASAAPAK